MNKKALITALGFFSALNIAVAKPAYSLEEKADTSIIEAEKEKGSKRSAVATGNVSSNIDPRFKLDNNGIMPVLSY